MNHYHSVDTLKELLKGEMMAVNTYGKAKDWQKDEQVADMFARFHYDHKRHAEQLANRIIELGGAPEFSTGFAGIMSDLNTRYKSLRGPKHVMKQIYDGEDKGVHAYEDRIDELDSSSKDLVRKIMGEDHDHLKYFKSRFEEEKAETMKH